MSKCNHQKNFFVEYEQALWGTIIVNDEVELVRDDPTSMKASRTGRVIVTCNDCGTTERYTRSTTPRWVKDILDKR